MMFPGTTSSNSSGSDYRRNSLPNDPQALITMLKQNHHQKMRLLEKDREVIEKLEYLHSATLKTRTNVSPKEDSKLSMSSPAGPSRKASLRNGNGKDVMKPKRAKKNIDYKETESSEEKTSEQSAEEQTDSNDDIWVNRKHNRRQRVSPVRMLPMEGLNRDQATKKLDIECALRVWKEDQQIKECLYKVKPDAQKELEKLLRVPKAGDAIRITKDYSLIPGHFYVYYEKNKKKFHLFRYNLDAQVPNHTIKGVPIAMEKITHEFTEEEGLRIAFSGQPSSATTQDEGDSMMSD